DRRRHHGAEGRRGPGVHQTAVLKERITPITRSGRHVWIQNVAASAEMGRHCELPIHGSPPPHETHPSPHTASTTRSSSSNRTSHFPPFPASGPAWHPKSRVQTSVSSRVTRRKNPYPWSSSSKIASRGSPRSSASFRSR